MQAIDSDTAWKIWRAGYLAGRVDREQKAALARLYASTPKECAVRGGPCVDGCQNVVVLSQ